MNLASKLAQPRVGMRRRNQLQAGTNGLGDAATAGSLRLFEKVQRYFHGDLARCFHDDLPSNQLNIPYSTPALNMAALKYGRDTPRRAATRVCGAAARCYFKMDRIRADNSASETAPG